MTEGRYSFEKEIGRGASGPVWLGHDTVLGRAVALKRVGTTAGGISAQEELGAREARLAAALNHPHVVDVFDLVAHDGEHWLVMEHVAGPTLSQYVRERGSLPGPEAAALLAQVAEALGAAHRAGIVHRDVKPSNILLTPDGVAKLTDFGIAKAADDPSHTMTGLVTGSPAYLAPEVATGSSATPASDVWSLGATLFHVLAGRPPYYVGDNVLSTMYRIVHEDPPRLPETGRLNHVLERTMATDPDHRWSMSRVQEALAFEARATAYEVRQVATPPDHEYEPEPDVSPTRSTAAVLAAPAAQHPVRSAASGARSRRPALRWVAGGVAAVAVAAITVLAFNAGQLNSDRGSTTPPPSSVSPTTPASSPSEPAAISAAQMETFVDDYLSTVTRDPRATWERLTPAFQEESDGFGSYAGFWRTVESASAADVRADPENLRVTYAVNYVMKDGSRVSDTVTLQLEQDGDSLLIADES